MVEEMGPAMEGITEQVKLYLQMARELFFAFLDVAEMSIDQLIETASSLAFKDSYYAVRSAVLWHSG